VPKSESATIRYSSIRTGLLNWPNSRRVKDESPGRDHVTDSLVECLDLLGLQVADDGVDGGQQLVNEGHHFPHLFHRAQNNNYGVQTSAQNADPLESILNGFPGSGSVLGIRIPDRDLGQSK